MYDFGDEFRAILGSTGIEYDPQKEKINRKKHGYSFESAVYFLERFVFPFGFSSSKKSGFFTRDVTNISDERRFEHLTEDDNKNVVFMVTTMRPNEKVRIISLRRAHEQEEKTFYDLCRDIICN